MNIVWIILAVVAGSYFIAVVEYWSITGRFQPGRPLLSGLALLGRESIVPRKADRTLYETAPVLLLGATLLALAVLPLAPGLIITDLATGALFVNAALAYVMVALVMAGWGADGIYQMIGGWRFLSQLIAYAMMIVMTITAAAMRASSLFTTEIVVSQATLWNILAQPLGFVLFWLAGMALAFLPPFNLPVGSDLAGGVEGEYSGMRLAVFRLGHLVLVLTISGAVTVFFLGGWLGPFLPGWLWTGLKTLLVATVMLVAGRYLPRLKEEQLLEWGWKLGIPLALANILWVGITLLLV
ncbi:MAG TPA: complex I subunit 1 family protein [Chloroflexia bacterium]|nr:complex I subunit 1 family protein [Chloroflexia bacterium]